MRWVKRCHSGLRDAVGLARYPYLVCIHVSLWYFDAMSWAAVVRGSYGYSPPSQLTFTSQADLTTLLDVAREQLVATTQRRLQIAEQSKNLIGLSTLLLAVGALLPTRCSDGELARVPYLLGALALLQVVILLLEFHRPSKEVEIALGAEDVSSAEDELKRRLIQDYRFASASNDGRTNYLVDVFRGAQHAFAFAFVMLFVLFAQCAWR